MKKKKTMLNFISSDTISPVDLSKIRTDEVTKKLQEQKLTFFGNYKVHQRMVVEYHK